MNLVAKKVRELREKKGLTQAELANLTGLTPNYITRFETGEFKNPKKSTIDSFAKALGVHPAEILFEHNTKREGLQLDSNEKIISSEFIQKRIEKEGYIKPDKKLREFIEMWHVMTTEQRKTIKTVAKSYVGDIIKKSKGSSGI